MTSARKPTILASAPGPRRQDSSPKAAALADIFDFPPAIQLRKVEPGACSRKSCRVGEAIMPLAPDNFNEQRRSRGAGKVIAPVWSKPALQPAADEFQSSAPVASIGRAITF